MAAATLADSNRANAPREGAYAVSANGYAPVFNSVFRGTLCGRWPDLAVWLTLLPLMDEYGRVDMTHEAIAALTGWPLQLLRNAIEALEQPDPRSRSKAEEGRRLLRLDPERDWGWLIVNHGLYREKASGRQQVEDGRNAAKVKRYKERHRQTPADTEGHPETPMGHQSDTNAYAYAYTDKNSLREKTPSEREGRRAKRSSRVPEDFSPDLSLAGELPGVEVEVEVQKFRDWEFKTPRSDWRAAWRNWIQRCKETGNYAKKTKRSEWL